MAYPIDPNNLTKFLCERRLYPRTVKLEKLIPGQVCCISSCSNGCNCDNRRTCYDQIETTEVTLSGFDNYQKPKNCKKNCVADRLAKNKKQVCSTEPIKCGSAYKPLKMNELSEFQKKCRQNRCCPVNNNLMRLIKQKNKGC